MRSNRFKPKEVRQTGNQNLFHQAAQRLAGLSADASLNTETQRRCGRQVYICDLFGSDS